MSTDDLKEVLKTLDAFGSTFDAAAEVPHAELNAQVPGDNIPQPTLRKALSPDDRIYLNREMSKLSTPELIQLASLQLRKQGRGLPVEEAWDYQTKQAMGMDPEISKVLDSSATALQRQDLEPILYPIFVRAFPAFERLTKEPSNGLVHTWNQITDYGDAEFMTELGTVSDDTATYVRQTTNIAQLGTRRGVTFKEQLAVPAGGMSWNPAQLEIENGLIAMAHKLQKTIFQGQASNSGGTASNELGLYDPNGFTGLRSILNTSDAVNFSPYLTSSPESFVEGIGDSIVPITNNVGTPPDMIFARYNEVNQFTQQERTLQRFVDRTEVIPGVMVPSVATAAGILPIMAVPGDSIGTYTASTFSNKTVADVYVLNSRTITLPYLGAPGPSIIEIPPGVSGQLTRLYIVWALMGLAVKIIPSNNKARANQATS